MAAATQVHDSWLAAEFAGRLAQVLESMTGEPAGIDKPVVIEGSPAAPDAQFWRFTLDPIPEGGVLLAAPKAGSEAIGAQSLRAAGVDPAPDDSQSTFLEMIVQAVSALCQTLSQKLGREVTAGPAAKCEPGGAETWEKLIVSGQEVFVSFTGSARRALTPPAAETRELAPAPQPAMPADSPGRTFDLLLDVEMPVSISFGRASLALKDALKLTTGSIVELNRSVAEPVEVIVNNCVIARGEVVVIEGNYGVRITQIISRKERLRTLK